MNDGDRSLAGDLSLAVVRLARHLRGRRGDSPVSLTQLSALSTLYREGSMTPGALAAREWVQPPSMTRVISSLAESGLVERTAHPTDGRQIIVSLSASGTALIEGEASAREAWLAERLAVLDPEQRASLRSAVDVITELVNEHD